MVPKCQLWVLFLCICHTYFHFLCSFTIIINCSRHVNATENVDNVCYKKGRVGTSAPNFHTLSIQHLDFVLHYWGSKPCEEKVFIFYSFYIALQGIIKSNLIYNKGLDAFAHLVMIMEYLLLTLHMQTRPVFS